MEKSVIPKPKKLKHRSPTPPPSQIHRDKTRYDRSENKKEIREIMKDIDVKN